MKDSRCLEKKRALFLAVFYVVVISLALYSTWIIADAIWDRREIALWAVVAWTVCVYVMVNGIHITIVIPKKRI